MSDTDLVIRPSWCRNSHQDFLLKIDVLKEVDSPKLVLKTNMKTILFSFLEINFTLKEKNQSSRLSFKNQRFERDCFAQIGFKNKHQDLFFFLEINLTLKRINLLSFEHFSTFFPDATPNTKI